MDQYHNLKSMEIKESSGLVAEPSKGQNADDSLPLVFLRHIQLLVKSRMGNPYIV